MRSFFLIFIVVSTYSQDIKLKGTISADNNQIKNVASPTDADDAATKSYVDQRTLEQTISGQNIGDLLYWNGQGWQKLSAPQEQSTLRFCEGQLTWEPCAPEIYINVFSQNDSSFGVYGKVLFNGLLYNELGVVYSNTTQSPTINDIKALDDDIEEYRNDDFAVYGSFYNLDLESTYFIRAYCISDKGVSYSKEVFSFTTGSLGSSAGGEYKKYGDQHWTLENYGEISYQDGTSIPQVTDATEWANLTTGAWCYYDNDPSKGKLYNWYAVAGIHDNDPNTPNKEFAPEGWHLPSDSEWTTLIEHFIANGYNYDGTTTGNKIAKAMASKTGWNTSTSTGSPGNNQSNNNSSEFNALPIGYRETNGGFFNEGNDVIFWTSSGNYSNSNASYRHLNKDNSSFNHWSYSMKMGYSVRFVKD
tara:strand:- start:13 stop:1263 length:1251 start_codon:yes stop_codon:yes gene_type:complete